MPKQAPNNIKVMSSKSKSSKKQTPSAGYFARHKKALSLLSLIILAVAGTYYLNLSTPKDSLTDYLTRKELCHTDTTKSSPEKSASTCVDHIDGAPPGVNLEERLKTIDKELQAQVEFDAKHPAQDAGLPVPPLFTE